MLVSNSMNKRKTRALSQKEYRYHFYFEPERQQVYQLSQMAAAMAVDLRIHRSVHSRPQQNDLSIVNIRQEIFNAAETPEDIELLQLVESNTRTPSNHSPQSNCSILDATSQLYKPRMSFEDIEARRTFLGTYWLSSS